MIITVEGWDFSGIGNAGAVDALGDAAASLQLVACGAVPATFRLRHGIETGPQLAVHLAPAFASAYSVDAAELLSAWSSTFAHDLDALRASLAACVPPKCLTGSELVDGL